MARSYTTYDGAIPAIIIYAPDSARPEALAALGESESQPEGEPESQPEGEPESQLEAFCIHVFMSYNMYIYTYFDIFLCLPMFLIIHI